MENVCLCVFDYDSIVAIILTFDACMNLVKFAYSLKKCFMHLFCENLHCFGIHLNNSTEFQPCNFFGLLLLYVKLTWKS